MIPRKSAPLFCIALLIALFATGCRQDSAAEAETATDAETRAATDAAADPTSAETAPAPAALPPPPPPAPEPGTDAAVIEDRATPTDAAPSFDAKAFAGRYSAGDTVLEIDAGGMFSLTGKDGTISGTWTLQPDGRKVTLDPDSKSEQDRTLEVISADSVKLDGAALQRG
jgi:copper homeostasis protein (lipoprotein)